MNGINELITIVEVLEGVERPAAGRAGAQQPRPQPGHVGAAGHGRRSEVRGSQDLPDFPYARTRESLGLDGHPRRSTRTTSAAPGTRRSRPTARSSSRRSPTRTCRRCRRTSRSSRRRRIRARSQGRSDAASYMIGETIRTAVAARLSRRMMETRPVGTGRDPHERSTVAAYEVPTETRPSRTAPAVWSIRPRSSWSSSPAGGVRGIGYTYAGSGAARVIREVLADAVRGRDALRRSPRPLGRDGRAVRNLGRPGRRVDGDLRRRRRALGPEGEAARAAAGDAARCRARSQVPVYGSGGFTSYTDRRSSATSSAAGRTQGIPRVKMKVGRDPSDDLERVHGGAQGDRRRRASCSSTPTAPTRASRRSRLPSGSPTRA